jgi:protein-arginine kinase activator protein McsA
LGCATCYQRFSESLQGALAESQKGLIHQGKRPSRKRAGDEEWQAELKHLIAIEDFEGAARLRDQITAKKKSTPRRTKSA